MTDTVTAPAAGAPAKPATKPARPFFSSGPCAKPPGWDAPTSSPPTVARPLAPLEDRQARLQYCIDLMRELLQLPDTHRIGIVPGSDTGAFEMAMWTMLGARRVTTLAWESFGEGWVTDAVKQLKIDPDRDPRRLRPAARSRRRSTGRTTCCSPGTAPPRGVRVPDADWIPADREGLSFADATSGVFAYDIDWAKIDVATFSWQKVLGGEGGARRADPRPARGRAAGELHPRLAAAQGVPPRLEGQADRRRVQGRDDQHAVDARGRGRDLSPRMGASRSGADGLIARSDANAAALDRIVAERDWLGHLAADPAIALEDQRLPDGRGRRRGAHQGDGRRCSRRKARRTTSPAIATRRRACASGAARPSTPPISRRSGRGSTGPTRRRSAA